MVKSYRKILVAVVALLFFAPAFAQVQKGYVRTCGRPNNPKGTRISGVTIRVSGLHGAVVSKDNGYFDFDLGGGQTSYSVTSVRDNSYQYELQEKELLNRKEPVSTSVPKEIVMVSLAEKRAIEAKKRQQIENQYQKDVERLEMQKAQNQITIEQYRQHLQELQDAFDKRDMLISDLSEYFANIDYAMLSEEQARISALLEEGDLLTADSIINAKGSIEDRLETYLDFKGENDEMEAALRQRHEDKIASRDDLMKDCEAKFRIYEQQHLNDSAAYFLEILVRLDTMNVTNMNRAGDFISDYLSKYDRAMDYYQRALRISQKQYGENSAEVVTCYGNIGEMYDVLGDYDQSMKYHEKALAICRGVYGEQHAEVAKCYSGIGLVYEVRDNYAEALKYYEKTLEIRKMVLGETHPDLASSYNNIGMIYHYQGEYEKSMEYLEKALTILKNAYGETNRFVAQSYNNIGTLWYDKGDYDKALECFSKALEINKVILARIIPASHLHTAISAVPITSSRLTIRPCSILKNLWRSRSGLWGKIIRRLPWITIISVVCTPCPAITHKDWKTSTSHWPSD